MHDDIHECCLCGQLFVGMGNNPWPITPEGAEYRCCDECNSVKVIPARLRMICGGTSSEKE